MDISSFPGQKPVPQLAWAVEPGVEPVWETVLVLGLELVFPVGLESFQLRPEA